MTSEKKIFHTKWYHVCMALIYILAGVFLIIKGNSDHENFPSAIGWLLCAYGGFRLISRLLMYRRNSENPD
jgi:hypothetical protein